MLAFVARRTPTIARRSASERHIERPRNGPEHHWQSWRPRQVWDVEIAHAIGEALICPVQWRDWGSGFAQRELTHRRL